MGYRRNTWSEPRTILRCDLIMYFIVIAQLQDRINSILDHPLGRRNRIAIDKRQHVTVL